MFFHVIEARQLLKIRPVYRKQQENFDRVLKCVTHLIYLLVATSQTDEEKHVVSVDPNVHLWWNPRAYCYKFILY